MKAFLAATVAPTLVAQTVAPTQARTGPPAPGPVPWMQGLDHAKLEAVTTLSAEDIAETDTVFFNAEQMAAVTRVCDLLMPPLKGQPGASAAGVPGFLDFFVSESSAEVQGMYRGGAEWLNSEAMHRFQVPFARLSATQADAIVRPLLRTWMSDHYPDGEHERFINAAHQDIRMATTNSQAWADAVGEDERTSRRDMYWSPVEPDLQWKTAGLNSRSASKSRN